MLHDLTPEQKIKLDLLALFTNAGRSLPMTVSEAFNAPLKKVLDSVHDAGLSYEQIGRSLSLRKEVLNAELYKNLGYNHN